ncbi:MAG: hypothetical protein Fur0046_33060 [Cyanobacteria bacterium J069]|nr:MAG: methyltransferase domain-containing protein [Cyanobacteria bacterium J069]
MKNVEQIKCHVCDNSINPTLILENFKSECHIVRCPRCNLTFVHPQPSPEVISAYYNGLYSELATEYNERKMRWARTSIEGYCLAIKKYKRPNSNLITLLDLGGGLGYYSKAFEEAGFSVTLVEQDPVSVKFAREVLKIENLIDQGIEQFFEANCASMPKYDVIFMRHVIEHYTSPGALLGKVGECLAERGIFIIETDNNAGIELLFRPGTASFYTNLYRSSFASSSYFSLLRKRPFAVDPPRHLYGFRSSNLSRLLRKNSLIPVKTIFYRLGHPIYWPNLPSPTFKDILSQARHPKTKHFIHTLMDFALLPFRLFLEFIGLSSGLCIYAVKDTRD